MTQTGKCDTCRQRKVKCDEEKPKCSACRKKDRPCLYSYGKASAFVMQDPNHLTRHGKSKIAPVVLSLETSEGESSTSDPPPSDLQITTERVAENGQGFFQTLAPMSRRKIMSQRKMIHQRRKLEAYLQQLQSEAALTTIRPTSPETTLIARYIDMIGYGAAEYRPLSILGTWIESIPSRIGSNTMMDLAVEFFVSSYDVYLDDTHSKRKLARASKEKALKDLQLFMFNTENTPTYEVLLATKMHYAAEALLGIDTMYHAIHAFGLAELLKSGNVANVDDEHYWSLIDNTYSDDVNEALMAGRQSVYDNDFYLSTTCPPPLSSHSITLSAYQRASMAIMHMLIQIPRLNCLVRYSAAHPQDTEIIATTITLAEYLWQLDLPGQVSPLLSEATTIDPSPPFESLKDMVTESLRFDSVQNMVLCSRYWMLLTLFGGLVDTLYRYYPAEVALSLLPSRYLMHKIETDSALRLVKSVAWAGMMSKTIPLVSLRLHTPLQISIGPWYRTIQRLKNFQSASPGLDDETSLAITRNTTYARRMKDWVIAECNRVHKQWGIVYITEKPLIEALNTMAGGEIPAWMPTRVCFDGEDGEMVMKLEYENKAGTYHEAISLSEEPAKRLPETAAAVWAEAEHMQNKKASELSDISNPVEGLVGPYEPEQNSTIMEPLDAANFIHSTGRNLCSAPGWWPNREDLPKLLHYNLKFREFNDKNREAYFTLDAPPDLVDHYPASMVLPDRTLDACFFSSVLQPTIFDAQIVGDSLASSFLPQTPQSAGPPSDNTIRRENSSHAWNLVNDSSISFDSNRKDNTLSQVWAEVGFSTPSFHDSQSSPQ
ncbi:hypothetical protein GQ44DRAFT_773740 [Phaeosphaeriaceae sp. PMI808]|nr:hypothetical protein GQ44DRAFT_773740 [Phaeosphaeriaceae sp. PMI808]